MKYYRIMTQIMLLPVMFGMLLSVMAQTSGYAIQVKAVMSMTEADSMATHLKQQGLNAYLVKSRVPGQGVLYRVRIGQYTTRELARKTAESWRRIGRVREYFIADYLAPLPVDLKINPSSNQQATTLPAPIHSTTAPVTTQPDPVKVLPPAIEKQTPNIAVVKPVVEVKPEPALKTIPVVTAPPPPAPLSPGYRRYEDAEIGFSFDCPSNWKGGRWLRQDQKAGRAPATHVPRMDAAANFNSETDLAFVNAIWNYQESANSDRYDNNEMTETILQSMRATPGVRALTESGRRVIKVGDQIRTVIELRARLGPAEAPDPVEFSGRAILIRGRKGVLAIAAFYSPQGPAADGKVATRIVESASLW